MDVNEYNWKVLVKNTTLESIYISNTIIIQICLNFWGASPQLLQIFMIIFDIIVQQEITKEVILPYAA